MSVCVGVATCRYIWGVVWFVVTCERGCGSVLLGAYLCLFHICAHACMPVARYARVWSLVSCWFDSNIGPALCIAFTFSSASSLLIANTFTGMWHHNMPASCHAQSQFWSFTCMSHIALIYDATVAVDLETLHLSLLHSMLNSCTEGCACDVPDVNWCSAWVMVSSLGAGCINCVVHNAMGCARLGTRAVQPIVICCLVIEGCHSHPTCTEMLGNPCSIVLVRCLHGLEYLCTL